MAYEAKILADSVAPNGARLTTFEITYPLMVHNELMTHRDFSRNAASSRAIPVKRMIDMVKENPFVPERFPKNQKGMQALEYWEQGTGEYDSRLGAWLKARDNAVESAELMVWMDVHKQIANRLLAPWQWITVVVSATRFSNFFALRCHPDAQPEIQKIAYMIRDLYEGSVPRELAVGQYHLPYYDHSVNSVDENACWEYAGKQLKRGGPGGVQDLMAARECCLMVSAARCARVSYLTHATDAEAPRRSSVDEDIVLATRLAKSGHMSPFEHVACPHDDVAHQSGNFVGWVQYRKSFEGECR